MVTKMKSSMTVRTLPARAIWKTELVRQIGVIGLIICLVCFPLTTCINENYPFFLDGTDSGDDADGADLGTIELSRTSGAPGTILNITATPDLDGWDTLAVFFDETGVPVIGADPVAGEYQSLVPVLDAGEYQITLRNLEQEQVSDTIPFTVETEADTGELPGVIIEKTITEEFEGIQAVGDTLAPKMVSAGMLTADHQLLLDSEIDRIETVAGVIGDEIALLTDEEKTILDTLFYAAEAALAAETTRKSITAYARNVSFDSDYSRHYFCITMDAYSSYITFSKHMAAIIGMLAVAAAPMASVVAIGKVAGLINLMMDMADKILDVFIPTDLSALRLGSTESDGKVHVPLHGEGDVEIFGTFVTQKNPIGTIIEDSVQTAVGMITGGAVSSVIGDAAANIASGATEMTTQTLSTLAKNGLNATDPLVALQNQWQSIANLVVPIDPEVYTGGVIALADVMSAELDKEFQPGTFPYYFQKILTYTFLSADTGVANFVSEGSYAKGISEGETTITGNGFHFKEQESNTSAITFELPASVYPQRTSLGTVLVEKMFSITPNDGDTDVAATADIVITFDSDLSTDTIGSVTLSGVEYQDDINCAIAIAENTITVNPDEDFETGQTYTAIAYSGFQTIDGDPLSETRPDYTFTVETNDYVIEFDFTIYENSVLQGSGSVSYTSGKTSAGMEHPSGWQNDGVTQMTAFGQADGDLFPYFEMSFWGETTGDYLNDCFMLFFPAEGNWMSTEAGDFGKVALMQVSRIDDIGGAIEGTFSGTLYAPDTISANCNVADFSYYGIAYTYTCDVTGSIVRWEIENGYFFVKHVAPADVDWF
jgi:hypothetical protein